MLYESESVCISPWWNGATLLKVKRHQRITLLVDWFAVLNIYIHTKSNTFRDILYKYTYFPSHVHIWDAYTFKCDESLSHTLMKPSKHYWNSFCSYTLLRGSWKHLVFTSETLIYTIETLLHTLVKFSFIQREHIQWWPPLICLKCS